MTRILSVTFITSLILLTGTISTHGATGSAGQVEKESTYDSRNSTDNGIGFPDGNYPLTGTNTPPGTPTPYSPVDSQLVGLTGFELIADSSMDAENDTIFYFFEIFTDTTYSSAIAADTALIIPGMARVHAGPFSVPETGRFYFWRVRAWDKSEYSAWSTWQIFRTRAVHARLLVPESYSTIQAAVDAASAGDTVVINSGTYTGDGNRDLAFGLKYGITVLGTFGPNSTTLDAQGSALEPHRLITLLSTKNTNLVFNGLDFVHGYDSVGGAVYALNNITFTNCSFRYNQAVNGGAISAPNANVSQCLFDYNSATDSGGALYGVSNSTVTDCKFWHNSASYGGVVAGNDGHTYNNCEFDGNSGIHGAISNGQFIGETFNNCLIANSQGPVIQMIYSGASMNYCTVVNNSANICAIDCEGSAIFKGSIIAFNGGVAAACPDSFAMCWGGHARATNSDIYGNSQDFVNCLADDADINGNFSANPMFCSETDDFRLQVGSPCATASSDGGPIGYGSVGCQTIDVGDDNPPLAYTFELTQNYPNPFNPTTTINYSLAKASEVRLAVYNILGQIVDELINQRQSAGNYSVSWDGTDRGGHPVASGIYFYRISAGEYVASKKMILLK